MWRTIEESLKKILRQLLLLRNHLNNLQGRVNAQRSQTSKPDWGQFHYRSRGGSYQPKYVSWGCQNCKERERGKECDHCFACGSSGQVAPECPRNRNRGNRQGNGRRLFRQDTIVDNNSYKSHQCNGCGHVQLERAKFLQCSKCKAVKYCCRASQKKH